MGQDTIQEKLRRATEDNLTRYACVKDALTKRPPTHMPGDVFLLEQSTNPADPFVVHVIALEDPNRTGRWLVVPGDTFSLAGTSDVPVPETSTCGSLNVRCGLGFWVDTDHLSLKHRVGYLGDWHVERLQKKLNQLENGEAVGILIQKETDDDPHYKEWIESVSQVSKQLVREHEESLGLIPAFEDKVTHYKTLVARAFGFAGAASRGLTQTQRRPLTLPIAAAFLIAAISVGLYLLLRPITNGAMDFHLVALSDSSGQEAIVVVDSQQRLKTRITYPVVSKLDGEKIGLYFVEGHVDENAIGTIVFYNRDAVSMLEDLKVSEKGPTDTPRLLKCTTKSGQYRLTDTVESPPPSRILDIYKSDGANANSYTRESETSWAYLSKSGQVVPLIEEQLGSDFYATFTEIPDDPSLRFNLSSQLYIAANHENGQLRKEIIAFVVEKRLVDDSHTTSRSLQSIPSDIFDDETHSRFDLFEMYGHYDYEIVSDSVIPASVWLSRCHVRREQILLAIAAEDKKIKILKVVATMGHAILETEQRVLGNPKNYLTALIIPGGVLEDIDVVVHYTNTKKISPKLLSFSLKAPASGTIVTSLDALNGDKFCGDIGLLPSILYLPSPGGPYYSLHLYNGFINGKPWLSGVVYRKRKGDIIGTYELNLGDGFSVGTSPNGRGQDRGMYAYHPATVSKDQLRTGLRNSTEDDTFEYAFEYGTERNGTLGKSHFIYDPHCVAKWQQ